MIANYQPYGNYYDNFEYFCPWVRYRSKSHHPSNTSPETTLSAENQFMGRITKIVKGNVVSQVIVDIGCGNSMSCVITTTSVEQLRLRVGLQVRVIVNSNNVMIMGSSPNMASNSNNMMPNSGKMMPNSNNMMPNSGNMMPNSNNMMPNSGNMMPNSNNMMPNSGNMMPNSNNMMPNSGNMMPNSNNTMHNSGNMMPNPNVKSNKEKSQMTLSARNQLKGTVTKIIKGDVVSQVMIDIGCRNSISSVITTASLGDLRIRVGSKVNAVVKSTDVMIMR